MLRRTDTASTSCIFSGSSHPALTDAICERLGQQNAKVILGKFSNGETRVEIGASVRDQDVFIVQSGSNEVNDNVMELLIMIQACKGGSARSITAVLPYFPYSRQSKKKTHRGAIAARMLANLMNVAGVNHVITIDLHASQSQGFFKCPVDNLVAEPVLCRWVRHHLADYERAVVVSKNPGGTKRVVSIADALDLSFGIVTTDRRRPGNYASMQNSAIFEALGLDGQEQSALELDGEEVAGRIGGAEHSVGPRDSERGTERAQQMTNGENHSSKPVRHRAATAGITPTLRSRLSTGVSISDTPVTSSPLAHSTRLSSIGTEDGASGQEASDGNSLRRFTTAPGIEQPPHEDEDGYEEPPPDDDSDERARDVITGRLIHGHIVDDDVPSPSMSVRSGSIQGVNGQRGSRSSEEDQLPDPMLASFMSTASAGRMHAPVNGLGGTGDATASDEEEEEALRDPDIEHTVTLVGNVQGRPVLIVDDIIDKAGSWIAAAETVVKRGGATKVYCMATHGIFGGSCLRELDACDEIKGVIVTDAFPIPEEKRRLTKKLVILDVSGLLAEAIRRNHNGESISLLYNHFN